ncbi:disease resistance protein At4g27190-like [Tasmannia lanceolata]|uniref:disease resistance protein At4g27190-like n=1 Tax=Tasmannia lanceolata TaxID=3420 RepID=UPI004062C9FF
MPCLKQLIMLEQLDLSNCANLHDIQEAAPSFGHILPKLRILDLANTTPIVHLSLRGNSSLETISLGGLTNLEVLDLSGTIIKEFPYEISDFTRLRRLDLLDTKSLLSVDWERIRLLPQELIWNHCEGKNGDGSGAFICVTSAEFFGSLKASSPLWNQNCFSRFRFCISPYEEQRTVDEDILHLRGEQFFYNNYYTQSRRHSFANPKSHLDRHLEIRGDGRLGDKISGSKFVDGVLGHTDSLTLCNNMFVTSLSVLENVRDMAELKECEITKCNNLENVFVGKTAMISSLRCLEKLCLSHLARLRTVCEGTIERGSFTSLKSICIEFCPRLVKLFSSDVCLGTLETLEIRFCARLEEMFQGGRIEGSSLQRLHTICLWELPHLTSIYNGHCQLRALKKLKVKGCPKLRKLPLRVIVDDPDPIAAPTKVEVEGELKWWNQLNWEGEGIKCNTQFHESHPYTI